MTLSRLEAKNSRFACDPFTRSALSVEPGLFLCAEGEWERGDGLAEPPLGRNFSFVSFSLSFSCYSTARPSRMMPEKKIMRSRSLRKSSWGMRRTTGMLMSTPSMEAGRETSTASMTSAL